MAINAAKVPRARNGNDGFIPIVVGGGGGEFDDTEEGPCTQNCSRWRGGVGREGAMERSIEEMEVPKDPSFNFN